MNTLVSLAVVSIILLVPLIPAAVLYKILSPKNVRREAASVRRKAESRDRDAAEGEIGAGDVRIAGFRIKFNVVGSSAIYIVLVFASFVMFDRITERHMVDEGKADMSAWLVDVPVKLRTPDKQELAAKNGELQQIRVELEPALTQASATTLQFWVVANNGKFPTARFSLPVSTGPEVLDLNDPDRVYADYSTHRMSGISPVWIEFGTPYSAANPSPSPAQPASAEPANRSESPAAGAKPPAAFQMPYVEARDQPAPNRSM